MSLTGSMWQHRSPRPSQGCGSRCGSGSGARWAPGTPSPSTGACSALRHGATATSTATSTCSWSVRQWPGRPIRAAARAGLAGVVAGYASEFMAVQLTARQASKWARQVEQLHELVPAWTGNPLQVVEMSTFEWADHRRRRTPLFTEIDRDAIQVAGETSLTSARTGPA